VGGGGGVLGEAKGCRKLTPWAVSGRRGEMVVGCAGEAGRAALVGGAVGGGREATDTRVAVARD